MVTGVARVAGDAERVRVQVDGAPAGWALAASIAALGVSRGATLDDATAAGLADAIDELGARRMALRLLRAATRTQAEVQRRLMGVGHSARATALAIEAAQEAGLIDDARLARHAAERFAAQPPGGSRLLESRLSRRGVSRPEVGRAVGLVRGELDDKAAALRLARGRVGRARPQEPDEAVARRVLGFLARRGFDGSVCRDAVRAALAERRASR